MEQKKVYIMQNWFKAIFLQILFDYIREKSFTEAKKRMEWKALEDVRISFEENCYLTNSEILESMDVILKELLLYNLCTQEEANKQHEIIKEAIEKNDREHYIAILLSTKQYNKRVSDVFSFSEDWQYLCWSSEKGENFQQAFRSLISYIQAQPYLIKRPANLADHFALFLLLNILAVNGLHLDIPYATQPLPGIGKSHTHLSISDPGRGHRQSTVLHPAYFIGNYINVEHLERLGRTRKDIESYRIPNILDFALLRACVGDLAPVITYIGRPMCEYSGKYDNLKAAHLTSAAISAFFALGAAEVKLSFEPLSIKQGIEYLCRLMTFRWHPRQSISIGFNLNRVWVDDRISDQTKIVSDKKEIGLLGIEVATAAGWDKITWDGASDVYPSICLMEQIDYTTALTLVHQAHQKGLTTYFSGGFTIGMGHIAVAVYTGVDGIGIGGAQILRLLGKEGHEGPFLEENILIINRERDVAEATIRGRAARLLACLDRLYFEGSLLNELETLRHKLFQEMLAINENALEKILQMTQSYDLPIGQEQKEEEYELLSCKRIAAANKNSLSYMRGSQVNQKFADETLDQLNTHIAQADSIPKQEKRIYYTDVLRCYRNKMNWMPEGGELRSKFYVLRKAQ